MNTEERKELMKLWEDVPQLRANISRDYLNRGWQSGGCSCSCGIDSCAQWLEDGLAEALARDAMVEWLLSNQSPGKSDQVQFAVEDDSNPSMKHAVDIGKNNWYHGPTRLLALVSACRAVKAAQ